MSRPADWQMRSAPTGEEATEPDGLSGSSRPPRAQRSAEDLPRLRPPGSARPSPCSARATGGRSAAPTWSSPSSRPTAGRRPPPSSATWRSSPGPGSPTAARSSRRWTSTRCWPATRRSRWSTSSPTPTCRARATRSAGRTSRSCSTPASTSSPTVNIQHLESLNDVVEKITGVPQRETVPDAVVRAADQVELVDMTPGGAAPPDGARQHLPGREDRRRADQLLPDRQPVRAARAGAALAGRQGRRGAAALPRGARHPRPRGRPGSAWSSR